MNLTLKDMKHCIFFGKLYKIKNKLKNTDIYFK